MRGGAARRGNMLPWCIIFGGIEVFPVGIMTPVGDVAVGKSSGLKERGLPLRLHLSRFLNAKHRIHRHHFVDVFVDYIFTYHQVIIAPPVRMACGHS